MLGEKLFLFFQSVCFAKRLSENKNTNWIICAKENGSFTNRILREYKKVFRGYAGDGKQWHHKPWCRVMSRMLRVYLQKNEDKSEKHICTVVQFCSLVCWIPTNLRAWSVFTLRNAAIECSFRTVKTIPHWWQTSTSKRQWVIMTWQHINNVSMLAGVNNH